METTNTETTQLAEQSQNPSQAGKASTSISRDVGKNMSQETGTHGGGLDARLDQADITNSRDLGENKKADNSLKIGAEGDAHDLAASKQP